MEKNSIAVSVLVNGREVKEYKHNRKTFIEGRHKSEFTIKVTNNSSGRKLVVLSVDGLSVMDGKPASKDSNGYIVDSYSSIDVPGWRLDSEEVAKFFFTSKDSEQSYSEQSGYGDLNTGVIGARVYNEKITYSHIYHQPGYWKWEDYNNQWNNRKKMIPDSTWTLNHSSSGTLHSGSESLSNKTKSDTFTSNAAGWNATSNVTFDSAPIITSSCSSSLNESAGAENVADELGTGFGDAKSFGTHSVSFDRGTLLGAFVIYYDTLRGLKSRGVPVHKGRKQHSRVEGNPFPADGCRPPKNWNKTKKSRQQA